MKLVAGILAHVDAGKTTLSEGLLYTSGSLRKMGRVDNRDAFLDTYELERERGITIFSKQANLRWGELELTLLDTPGHVDFSAEMERTLQVLDYAILLVSGADGVQGHTQTLWRLLKRYRIPVFLFVNKMDQNGTDRAELLKELHKRLDDGCIDFSAGTDGEDFFDALAMCSETAMEEYLDTGSVGGECIKEMIRNRQVFPCYFGSALKLQGVDTLLDGIAAYVQPPQYGADFGAKVFKISRDEQGNRLTYLKVTGGSLKVRDSVKGEDAGEHWEEKIHQLRVYSGAKYDTVNEVAAGTICAVTGLTRTRPGEGLGAETNSRLPVLEPVLTYQLLLPPGIDPAGTLPKLRQLEEEEPELHIVWDEELKEIQLQLMGEVQLEILTSMILERFGIDVSFGPGNIVYKETITDVVEGVGHFEPLRHYAEVHLLMEPLEPGSGMQFAADCSEDILSRNWQRLILTHLMEREHKGVLTGSPITDMKITLITGRAHLKHTEGGDFRQATYRAVRQGLMQAASALLEPYYAFRLEIPESMVGRAMTDIEHMNGKLQPLAISDGISVLTGTAPVSSMQGYQKEVNAYSKGHGQLQCTLHGYGPCHNPEEVIAARHYDPDSDLANPSSSVFCAHGAGYLVEWYEVKDYMHVESPWNIQKSEEQQLAEEAARLQKHATVLNEWIGTEEVDAIIEGASSANKKDKGASRGSGVRRRKRTYDLAAQSARIDDTQPPENAQKAQKVRRPGKKDKEYFLVDGYNIIFAWTELSTLAKESIDGARGRLLDILCNYQALRGCCLIVVFDAYRVEGHQTEYFDYHNIHVVYTKEAETADQYIERFAHEHGRSYAVTVATSDGLEQIIIRGQGCRLVSARELEAEVQEDGQRLKTEYLDRQLPGKNRPFEHALGKLPQPEKE